MKTRFFLLITVAVLSFVSCEKTPYEEEVEDNTELSGGGASDNSDSDGEEDWEDSDNDSDTPYVDPDVTDGNDNSDSEYSKGDILTVSQFINAKEGLPQVYVEGYIVAACANNKKNADFDPPFNMSSAILLADSKDERDVEKTVSISLKSGSNIRKALNLEENPKMLHKKVKVFGLRTTYLGLKGIKDVGSWELLD